MSETILRTRDQEMLAQGQVQEARALLRLLLEHRFGGLPEPLLQQIEQSEDRDRLRSAILQVSDLKALSELRL